MKSKYILAFATLFIAFSCEIYDLDINTDPNNPTKASLDLLLPTIQINWAYHYQSINDISAGIMGHTSNSDGLNFTQNSFDGLWSAIYLSEVSDLDEYVKAASLEDENGVLLTPGPLGVGKIYKAHIFSTLVDVFGDVPFTEAAQGNDDGNVAPAYDDQTAIYTACLTMLDEAIGHLSSTSLKVDGDMIYGGVTTRWLAAAYSMKLKLLMQVRNAPGFTYGTGVNAEIRDLIDNHAADLIGASSSKPSFAFNYNTNVALGQRHPWMGAVYSGDNSFSYIMHQLMYEMLINHDPRIAYYIKRQTTAELDQADASQKNTTPCSQNSACIYGYMVQNAGVMSELQAAGVITDVNGAADRAYVASFFGRDKGDPSGIPLDGPLRTAPGVYPMGGQYDVGAPSKISASNGVDLGNGVTYFISAAMVSMYKVEAYLDIYADAALARTELEKFINLSLDQVESVGVSIGAGSMNNVAADTQHKHVYSKTAYVASAMARYDAAADKKNAAFKEAWYSFFGSGFELYNSFRRTGYPRMKTDQSGVRGVADIQYPTFRATSSTTGQRNFPVRWTYPVSEFTLNPNLTDILLSDGTVGIFWDNSLFKYN